MTIRARFKVDQIIDNGVNKEVKMSPVTTGEGNESYSKWTPSGSLSMTITNPDAYSKFVVGKEYNISFEEREAS